MSEVVGAAIVARALKSMGVDTLFFLSGSPSTDIYKTCQKIGIKIIDVRHEQAAAMMAHAYSRVTGRPGVCVSGAGPDSLNLVTGIAVAFLDACPIVAISGSGSLNTMAMDGFQDLDQISVMKPIVKRAWQVPMAKRVPYFVALAFRHACANRPGPVYLDFPANLLSERIEEGEVEETPEPPVRRRPAGDGDLIRQAVEILLKAERPLILSGNGVLWSEASSELKEFVDTTHIPFYTTPISRGVIPEDHPLYFGGARTKALGETDALLVVGARPTFILSFLQPPRISAQAKIIMVNIDAEEIDHNRRVDVGIQGDAKAVLKQLIEEAGQKFKDRRPLPWVENLRKADEERQTKTLPRLNSNAKPIDPMRLCKEIRDFMPRDTILVVDGHDTLNYARQTIPSYYPGHRLNPGVSGCMGVGVPFGIGAKVAKPDKPVLVFSGDGSFGFNGMEMHTAIRHGIPIVVVINNNRGWVSKRREETFPGQDLGFVRYDKVVESLGGYGELVENPDDIRGALERAFSCGKPALLNVITDEYARSETQQFAADIASVI
jgi:acetolactate synthase-1/2/3 large subunit